MKPKNPENQAESSQNLAKNENAAEAAENFAKNENVSGVASDVAKTAMSAGIFRGEKVAEVDPMAEYYGMDADTVAQLLFGEDFANGKPGEFYSLDDDDIPYKVVSTGSDVFSISLRTGKFRGPYGLDARVVSQDRAKRNI